MACLSLRKALWTDPVGRAVRKRRNENKNIYRIFGPSSSSSSDTAASTDEEGNISFQFYTRAQQRTFVAEFGTFCQRSFVKNTENNILLQRFDALPEEYGLELWKYCVLYTQIGNVYYQPDNLTPLVRWNDLLTDDSNRAIRLASSYDSNLLHHSFLQVTKVKSKIAASMMRVLVESQQPDPIRLSELLGLYVSNDKQVWKFLTAHCVWTGANEDGATQAVHRVDLTAPIIGDGALSSYIVLPTERNRAASVTKSNCPVRHGGHCCQVWLPESQESWSAMVIRDPYVAPSRTYLEQQQQQQQQSKPYRDTLDETELAIPVEALPYIATIREVPNDLRQSRPLPSFFDILVENNCLPEGKDCLKCLQKEPYTGGQCQLCQHHCSCFCSVLCNLRPPRKPVAATWFIHRPLYRRDPHRLIPRVIHQTWYEPITQEKYPNMSRLIESFRQTGWEYNFYDDDKAAQFLSTHFPPAVREAYDAILPGAFKADLFRLCVLLIRGGIYADMDVMLESNLDEIIDGSIGFVTAQDEPGTAEGHRSCLWNGLVASAPGHPFLIKTIENVVNNVRNRYTSLDYDDMLCPNPVLSVSHSLGTLFTSGPCIVGASINEVLNRHMQTSFTYGDMDLFETERSLGDGTIVIDSDDPRLAIPGRTVLLRQSKDDMGAHRFTYDEGNVVVAATDLPDYDDRPDELVHYSKAQERYGIYGLSKLYANDERANEVIRIRIAS